MIKSHGVCVAWGYVHTDSRITGNILYDAFDSRNGGRCKSLAPMLDVHENILYPGHDGAAIIDVYKAHGNTMFDDYEQ